MKNSSGYKDADPAHDGFQYLEDLSTAYWYSQVFFTALQQKLFMHLSQGNNSIKSLAAASFCKEEELFRLLRALERMALVSCEKDIWFNSQVSSLFLIPEKPEYMGDFFLYRYYMQPNWDKLTHKVVNGEQEKETDLSYAQRNFLYVRAMDTLARMKVGEIIDLVKTIPATGAILDVGGGAGSMLRGLQKVWPKTKGIVFDIPEVIDAAEKLYPDKTDWQDITLTGGDFRTYKIDGTFSVIVLSNFLHAYGPVEAKELLLKAVTLLEKDGFILIHDYFPDRKGASPQKGALYDLSMMLNTFNGSCHEAQTVFQWLDEFNVHPVTINDLGTDTSLILAGGEPKHHIAKSPWIDRALELGFNNAVVISPNEVETAIWVNAKCRFGCAGYDKNLQCPPHNMTCHETRELLDSYTMAILLEGQPPGKQFHNKLLALEKQAFLDGYHKAFVLGAGPCPVCPSCPDDGKCRHPDLCRPSMEGTGIDVYATVKNGGWSLTPVKQKNRYVKYIGLLLLE